MTTNTGALAQISPCRKGLFLVRLTCKGDFSGDHFPHGNCPAVNVTLLIILASLQMTWENIMYQLTMCVQIGKGWWSSNKFRKYADLNNVVCRPSEMWHCAADFALLNLPKGKSLGRSKPATNSSNEQAH